jgi:hypothetical protein
MDITSPERSMIRIITSVLLLMSLGCAGSDTGRSADGRVDWTTVVDTVGDTIVMRTTGGSDSTGLHTLVEEVTIGELDAAEAEYSFGGINELEVAEDGRIYVFDRQVPALREYDPAGKYVRTVGRKGKGPGEYEQANGVAVHRDGRVVLWDASSARINVYRPDGTFIASWPLPGGGGFFTNSALFVDTAGNTYARTRIADPPRENAAAGATMFGTTGLVQWDRNGNVVDSLTPPAPTIETQSLVASREGGFSVYTLPFSARHSWVWSPLGYFVSARTDRYAVTLSPVNGQPRRIERTVDPVPVTSDERADHEERATASMRRTDPSWRWSGPSIPGTKPPIASIVAADDGKIWVSVARHGERIPAGEGSPGPAVRVGTVGDLPRLPEPRWRDPVVYDVFDPTGQYLGQVSVPPRTRFQTMRGDHVWGVRRDSLDVEQVVRFRVVPGFGNQKLDVVVLDDGHRRASSRLASRRPQDPPG